MTLYARQQKRHRCKEQSFGLWEKARVGWFERIPLKHVYYHMWNRSPVQVRCMIQGAQGWCTGMTQRDGMGREVGGGFRMGNACTPMADSCQCIAKPPQYCKVISLQLKFLKMAALLLMTISRVHSPLFGRYVLVHCCNSIAFFGRKWASNIMHKILKHNLKGLSISKV